MEVFARSNVYLSEGFRCVLGDAAKTRIGVL
jgi:hypothetical protein